MIVQSFYIADDEAFGISESEFNQNNNDFETDHYYEELSDQYSDNLEAELIF